MCHYVIFLTMANGWTMQPLCRHHLHSALVFCNNLILNTYTTLYKQSVPLMERSTTGPLSRAAPW